MRRHISITHAAQSESFGAGITTWLLSFTASRILAIDSLRIIGEGFPVDRQLYILNSVHDADFIRDQKLTMVYHGDTTEVGVYLAPEVATPPKQICDAALLPEHPLP